MNLAELNQKQIDDSRLRDHLRSLAALAEADGRFTDAAEIFEGRWGSSLHAASALQGLRSKAAVLPGTSTDATWAQPLVNPMPLNDAFASAVLRQLLLTRLGARPVPFAVNVPNDISGGTFGWVAQGAPKSATSLAVGNLKLPVAKIAGIVVLSSELGRLMARGSVTAVANYLIASVVRAADVQLLDPTVAATADHPSSLTHGVTPIAGTGDLDTDVAALVSVFFTARPNATRPVFVGSWATVGACGNRNVTTDGLSGLPFVVSNAAGSNLILVDADALAYASDAPVLDVSTEALVELNTAPTGGTSAVLVNLWTENLIGFRPEVLCNWAFPANAAQYLTMTSGTAVTAAAKPAKR